MRITLLWAKYRLLRHTLSNTFQNKAFKRKRDAKERLENKALELQSVWAADLPHTFLESVDGKVNSEEKSWRGLGFQACVCVQVYVNTPVIDAGKVFVCTWGSEVAHEVKSPKQWRKQHLVSMTSTSWSPTEAWTMKQLQQMQTFFVLASLTKSKTQSQVWQVSLRWFATFLLTLFL